MSTTIKRRTSTRTGKKASAKTVTIEETKEPRVSKAIKTHPTYDQMIRRAIFDLNNRKGSSRAAIKKYICDNWPAVSEETAGPYISRTLKQGVESGAFVQNKQSFRLNPNARRSIKTATEKKRGTRLSATKKSAKSATPGVKRRIRPIRKWATFVLKAEKDCSMNEDILMEELVKKYSVPLADQEMFARTFKAVITRGEKDGIWSISDANVIKLLSEEERKAQEEDDTGEDEEEENDEDEEEEENTGEEDGNDSTSSGDQ